LAGHRWQNGALYARYRAEIEAMRSSLAMGYLHHVELHYEEALNLIRRDAAASDGDRRP
jgi:hypothetical protein